MRKSKHVQTCFKYKLILTWTYFRLIVPLVVNTQQQLLLTICAYLHPHQEEIVGDDLEQVLLVLAEQHQPEGGVVDGEPEEALTVGAAGEPVVPGLGWCQ